MVPPQLFDGKKMTLAIPRRLPAAPFLPLPAVWGGHKNLAIFLVLRTRDRR
jgi:hypothetical protein